MAEPATNPEAVGERLRWAREQAGLSQSQVATILECHRPTVSQMEAGKRVVRPDEIAKLSNTYGVKEAWIIKGDAALDDSKDPRILLVARELAKLKKEDLDAILRVIRVMREP